MNNFNDEPPPKKKLYLAIGFVVQYQVLLLRSKEERGKEKNSN